MKAILTICCLVTTTLFVDASSMAMPHVFFDEEHIRLEAGSARTIPVPASSQVELNAHDALLDDLLIWEGDGTGLGVHREPEKLSGGHIRLRTAPVAGNRWLTLQNQSANDALEVRVRTLRIEQQPDPLVFDDIPHGEGGLETSMTRYNGAGSQPVLILEPGENWQADFDEPTRLQLTSRVLLDSKATEPVLAWQVLVRVNEKTERLEQAAGLDTTPPHLPVYTGLMTQARTDYVDIPAGANVEITTSHPLMLMLRSLRSRNLDVAESRLDQSLLLPLPRTDDIATLPYSMLEQKLGLPDLQTRFAALRRTGNDPMIVDEIIHASLSMRQGDSYRQAPLTVESQLQQHIAVRGQWLSMPFVAEQPATLTTRNWYSLLPVDQPRAPRRLPDERLTDVAARIPSARFLRTDTNVLFSRDRRTAGLVRLLSSDRSDGAYKLELLNEHGVLIDTRRVEPTNSAVPERESDSLLALRKAATRYSAEDLITSLDQQDVRLPLLKVDSVTLAIPAGIAAIRVSPINTSPTNNANSFVLQERSRKLLLTKPTLALVAQRGGLADARNVLAQSVKGEPGESAQEFEELLTLSGQLTGWLRSRWQIYADRLSARPAGGTLPGEAGRRMPGDPLHELSLATRLLDQSEVPTLRFDALKMMVPALESLGESYLAEMTLRGAMLYEAPEVSTWASEELTRRYREAGESGALQRHLVARFVLEPTNQHLVTLIAELEQSGETHWSDLLRGFVDDADSDVPAARPATVEKSMLNQTDRTIWKSAPEIVRSTVQQRRLQNMATGRGLTTFVVAQSSPMKIVNWRRGALRLVVYPQHTDTRQALSGKIYAEHQDGTRLEFPFTGNTRNRVLKAAEHSQPVSQPGSSETFILPDGGPWTISVAEGAADVTVARALPYDLQAVPDHDGDQPDPKYAALLKQAEQTGNRFDWWLAPVVNDESPQVIRTSRQITEVNVSPVSEMLGLIAQAIDTRSQAELKQLYAQAVKLELDNPALTELQGLRREVDPAGAWRNIDVVDASAGVVRLPRAAVQESTTTSRARVAMMGHLEDAQRVLMGSRQIRYVSSAERVRQVTVTLESKKLGYFSESAADVLVSVGGEPFPVTVNPGTPETRTFSIKPGETEISFSLSGERDNRWVAMTLYEDGKLVDWTVNQRFHAALPGEPIELSVNGPAVVRITRLDKPEPGYRVVGSGLQKISVQAGPQTETAYFRLAIREPALRKQVAGKLPPREDDADRLTPALSAQVALRYPESEQFPPELAYPQAVNATYSLGIEIGEQRELDDTLDEDESRPYQEILAERRAVSRRSDNRWHHTRLLVRSPDDGDGVVGLRHRVDHRFHRFGLTTYGYLDGYAQSGEYALTATAGIKQQRTIGPRSRHEPELIIFARELSLDEMPNDYQPDQDVFTRYKADHRYGVRIRDEWRYSPQIDQRFTAGFHLNSNENLSPDRLGINLGWEKLFTNTSLGLEYRYRHFFNDKHRDESTDANRIALDVDWRGVDSIWRQWQLELNVVYDFDASSYSAALNLTRHFSRGKGFNDFRPDAVNFRTLRRLGFPKPETEP